MKGKESIDSIIKGELTEVQACSLYNEKYRASPFASCFPNDCLALGKDSGAGGVRYNFIYPCFPGFINLINSIAAVREFVRKFMRNGNFEVQFNVVDQETLLDAQKHPEKYRTLLVRIAGYSDYFVDLAPVLQNEVIKRLEHDNL